MSGSNRSVAIAVVVLGAALAIALLSRRPAAGEGEALRTELRRVREERDALARQVEELRREPKPAAVPTPAAPPAPKPDPPSEVTGALQRALQALGTPEREPTPAELTALQAKAIDAAAPEQERVEALARLRSTRPDGRSPEVVRSMVALLDASLDAELRARICTNLHRVVSDDLKRSLLAHVRGDESAKVREEAAESLGPMKLDPVVRAALEQAAQADPDEKVKKQAKRSLEDARR